MDTEWNGMRNRCIKSKDHESNTTKSNGLYTRSLCDGAYEQAVISFKHKVTEGQYDHAHT